MQKIIILLILVLVNAVKKQIVFQLSIRTDSIAQSFRVVNAETVTDWNVPEKIDGVIGTFIKAGIGDLVEVVIKNDNDAMEVDIELGDYSVSHSMNYLNKWRCNDTTVELMNSGNRRLSSVELPPQGMVKNPRAQGTYLFSLTIPPGIYCHYLDSNLVNAPGTTLVEEQSNIYSHYGEKTYFEIECLFPRICPQSLPINILLYNPLTSNQLYIGNKQIEDMKEYPMENEVDFSVLGLKYGQEEVVFVVMTNNMEMTSTFLNLIVCYHTCKTCSVPGPRRVLSNNRELEVDPNENDHQCLECAENYEKDPNKPNNCIRTKAYQAKYNLGKAFNQSNVNIFDAKDPFFLDICTLFPLNDDIDVTRKDRINKYLQDNNTLCSSKCFITGVNFKTDKVDCDCPTPTKKNNELTFEGMKTNAIASLTETNYEVVFCYMLVFNRIIFPENIGSWVMIGIGIGMIVTMIVSFFIGQDPLASYLNEVLVKKQQGQILYPLNIHKNKPENKSIAESPVTVFVSNKSALPCSNGSSSNIILKKTNKKLTIDDYDEMEYEDMIGEDQRHYCLMYWGYLQTFQPILNTFFVKNKRVLTTVKISKFFIGIMLDLSLTAFFYSDTYVSNSNCDIDTDNDFIYNLPVSLYTYVVGAVIGIMISLLSNSEKGVSKIEEMQEIPKVSLQIKKFLKCYKIRIVLYDVLQVILLSGFWYYTAAFCAVYRNTQTDLMISYATSLGLSMLVPFITCLIFAGMRMIIISCKCKWLCQILSFIMWFF